MISGLPCFPGKIGACACSGSQTLSSPREGLGTRLFSRVQKTKLFLVWRIEGSDGFQLPCKLIGDIKGAGLPTLVLH